MSNESEFGELLNGLTTDIEFVIKAFQGENLNQDQAIKILEGLKSKVEIFKTQESKEGSKAQEPKEKTFYYEDLEKLDFNNIVFGPKRLKKHRF